LFHERKEKYQKFGFFINLEAGKLVMQYIDWIIDYYLFPVGLKNPV